MTTPQEPDSAQEQSSQQEQEQPSQDESQQADDLVSTFDDRELGQSDTIWAG
jgi:hypothetical protein